MSCPRVAVIVLHYGDLNLTLNCLGDVFRFDHPNYKVWLVNNALKPKHTRIIKELYPEVLILEPKQNRGFAGGINLALSHSWQWKPDYFLILNNDVRLKDKVLKQLVEFALKNERAGVVGPLVWEGEENTLVPVCGGRIRPFWFWCQKNFRIGDSCEVDFVSGCVFLLKREVVEKVGKWDERFFMYWEEIDYCLRAKKKGFKIYCAVDVQAYHRGQQGTGYLSPSYVYYMTRNHLLVVGKHYKGWRIVPPLVVFVLRRWGGYLVKLLARRKTYSLSALFWGVCDFLRGSFGKGRY